MSSVQTRKGHRVMNQAYSSLLLVSFCVCCDAAIILLVSDREPISLSYQFAAFLWTTLFFILQFFCDFWPCHLMYILCWSLWSDVRDFICSLEVKCVILRGYAHAVITWIQFTYTGVEEILVWLSGHLCLNTICYIVRGWWYCFLYTLRLVSALLLIVGYNLMEVNYFEIGLSNALQ